MLTFKEFQQYVTESVLNYIPDGDKYEASIIDVVKNNDIKLCGLNLKEPNTEISPVIYLEDAYADYLKGLSLDSCVRKIAETYIISVQQMPIEEKDFLHWDVVKDKIFCKLINKTHNQEYLEDRVYQEYGDLAVVYGIDFSKHFNDGKAYSILTKDVFEVYNISKEELHDVALKNTVKNYPGVLTSLQGRIFCMEFDMEEPANLLDTYDSAEHETYQDMMILTNTESMDGATVLLYPDLLDKVGEIVGGDFIVIPSSIHECLILPKNNFFNDKENLDALINEVNFTKLSPNEVLSDHTYEYDTLNRTLSYDNGKNIVIKGELDEKMSLSDLIEKAKKNASTKENLSIKSRDEDRLLS